MLTEDLTARIATLEARIKELQRDVDYALSVASTANARANKLAEDASLARERAMRGVRP